LVRFSLAPKLCIRMLFSLPAAQLDDRKGGELRMRSGRSNHAATGRVGGRRTILARERRFRSSSVIDDEEEKR